MKIDNRQARRLMERMGMNMKEIENVIEVSIITNEKEIKIKNPKVSQIELQGTRIFQVTGEVEEKKVERKYTEEDVLLVQQQAKVTRERAIAALEESNGEVARAILMLTTQG